MSAKQLLIGGGTGFIGKRLAKLMGQKGYDVTCLSRMPGPKRMTWMELETNGLPKSDTLAVVNLAGQNVLDPTRRWTPGFKQNVWNSRINTTSALVRAITQADPQRKIVFVNISGVSLYPADDKEHDESSPGMAYDYMSRLCVEWEKAATGAPTRTVKIRTGVVLGREGGMIDNLYWPYFFGLGGPIGEGKHPLPWIHIDDLCRLIKYAVENESVEGVLNGTAPEIITNLKFSTEFAKAMKRPALMKTPECVFDIIFGKERAVLLTSGPKVVPKRTLETGFKYTYPTIREACLEVVK